MRHKDHRSFPGEIIKRFPIQEYWFYLILFLLACLAAIMMIYDMEWGPWAFSDSAAYISAARNLVAGNGLSVPTPEGGFTPLTLHQPLFPLVLSFFLLFDIHPFTTTTVLNIACFSLSILFLGTGCYYFSKSKVFSLVVVILLMWCPQIIENFDGAMSEPLYLFLTILTFFLILVYVEQKHLLILILAALCAGFSILTRYIGVVNLAAGVIILFGLVQENVRNRFLKTSFFAGIAILPQFVWFVFSAGSDTPGSRQIIFPDKLIRTFENFWDGVRITLSAWLPIERTWQINDEIRTWIVIFFGIFILVSLVLATYFFWKKKKNFFERFERLIFSAAIIAFIYLLIFFITFAFSSIPPDINSRTLIPLFPFFLIILYGILFQYPRTHLEKSIAGIMILTLFSISFLVWYPTSRELLYDRHHNGHGYTSKYYQESTVLKASRDLPKNIPWISNKPAFFLLYLNKFPYDLSTIYPSLIHPGLTALGNGETDLDHVFREKGAALILLQPQLENDLRKLIGDQASEQIEKLIQGLDIHDQSYDGLILFDPISN
ncbi:MAG: hypothetical protein ACYDH1_02320 [Anaerolineaceae bacterium]